MKLLIRTRENGRSNEFACVERKIVWEMSE